MIMTRHSVSNNTRMNLVINIFSFKFRSFDQFNTPQIASNFRHLLSCGTTVVSKGELSIICKDNMILSLKNTLIVKTAIWPKVEALFKML